ncbi:Protein N-acetyltransferase, RimJ/RimL family [Chitinophaga jiangningensis]|uniref:Protein N-acetyltransferase, RimJ/RimL family n=2 Tax=Chitinophaga jiangningensis TaxID=1419482 RepID=A0A1M7LPN1_9BACT|nr:Protein N-acetyltransferase, RimJ/RimL family [Chitinophaga jiangningensis]
MFFLETERLKLIPLTHDLLQLCNQNRPEMEARLGLTTNVMKISQEYVTEIQYAMAHFWLPQTAAHPDNYFWYTNWEIVLTSCNMAIGGIGFAGAPDDKGFAEIGFMLDEHFHGQGYAAEALRAMINWAFGHEAVRHVVARTYEDNAPCRRLLLGAGFMPVAADGRLLTYRKCRPVM